MNYDELRQNRDDDVGELLNERGLTSDMPVNKAVMHVISGIGVTNWMEMTESMRKDTVYAMVHMYTMGRTDEVLL